MDKKDVWNLFVKTGKLEYYLKYKDMISKEVDSIVKLGMK